MVRDLEESVVGSGILLHRLFKGERREVIGTSVPFSSLKNIAEVLVGFENQPEIMSSSK